MMRRYASRALVQAFPAMLVIQANAALMRMSTPDAFISVPTQPRKLMRVCIIHGWSMTLVQRRGSFHWTRHAVWYSWRSTVMWVYYIAKLLRALSRFTSVVNTVSGLAVMACTSFNDFEHWHCSWNAMATTQYPWDKLSNSISFLILTFP